MLRLQQISERRIDDNVIVADLKSDRVSYGADEYIDMYQKKRGSEKDVGSFFFVPF